jgi:uncharacterized membrane protein YgcG
MRVLSSTSHGGPTIREDGGDMSSLWKVLLGLALVVPLGAYVAGSLAASASEDPAPRHTIVIEEPSPSPSRTPRPTPSETPESPRATDDGVDVIVPEYDDFDDDDDQGDDDHGGEDHSDDNSGHGGGDDDHSGDDHGGSSGSGGGDDE